ncbi:MAG: dTDP-4-dehydrorhamnose reductase, partial [Desulfovibrio sp.]|nr:dTDP-4-dehydrorhamnose reductase [Desulfovibrio sp.]
KTLGRENGDLTSKEFLKNHIKGENYDVIFNTVAWTQVDAAEDQPREAYLINATLPKWIGEIVRETSTHLVHISTDFVFGRSGNRPFKEEDQPNPNSVYGETKLEGEKALLAIIPERAAICRTAWLFGKGRKNFVSTILQASKTHSQLKVVKDQIGCPTYTADLASWLVSLAEKRACGIWHTVNSGHASWFELAKTALALRHIDCKIFPITSSEWPQKAQRPAYSCLENLKLSKFLGKSIRNWQDALRDYLY